MRGCPSCGAFLPAHSNICRFCKKDATGNVASSLPEPKTIATDSPQLWWVGLFLLPLLVGLQWYWDQAEIRVAAARFRSEELAADQKASAELEQIKNRNQSILESLRNQHQAQLSDAGLISGATAAASHSADWARRISHDPLLAHSTWETNILKMDALGQDQGLADHVALERVARLASPRGSRIEVGGSENQAELKVAFRMSAVSQHESGAVTKHHTPDELRREVRELSARLIKDIFAACGSRGIARLTVSCNHAVTSSLVPEDATPQEKTEILRAGMLNMSVIYRAGIDAVAARKVSQWRMVSVPRVMGLMQADYDGLRTLTISQDLLQSGSSEDPESDLAF